MDILSFVDFNLLFVFMQTAERTTHPISATTEIIRVVTIKTLLIFFITILLLNYTYQCKDSDYSKNNQKTSTTFKITKEIYDSFLVFFEQVYK